MTSRVPPSQRGLVDKRTNRWAQSIFPGAVSGRVANAFPLQTSPGPVESAEDSGGGSDTSMDAVSFENTDIYDLTVDGVQNLTLTYLPIPTSVHCELNGIKGRRGTDWEVENNTVTCFAAWDVREDDVVTVEYAYLEGMPTVPISEPVADSPLAYYRMDETSGTTLVDSSGNERDGTYTGSPTLGSTALVSYGGTSVTFDGSNYASIPRASIEILDQCSFEAWVATTSVAAIKVFFGSDNDTQRAFMFRFNAGKPEAIFLPSIGTPGTVTASSTANDGNPHHCVATYDGATILLYVDGVEVDASTADGNLGDPDDTLPWVIGERSPTVGAYAWVGRIDEVAIYDYPLSAEQVAEHYAAGS